MKLHEVTPPELRLNAFEALKANASSIIAEHCFYISHKTHFPDFKKILSDCLTKIHEIRPPTDRDVIVIDRSSEAGATFDLNEARDIVSFCTTKKFPLKNFVFISQTSSLPAIRDSFLKAGSSTSLSWLPYHHFFHRFTEHYREQLPDDFGFSRLVNEEPLILCTNNKLRVHRRVLVEYLIASGLSDRFILSYHANDALGFSDRHEEIAEKHFPNIFRSFKNSCVKDFFRLNPKIELPDDVSTSNFIDSIPERSVRRSLLTLVSESDFAPQFSRVTEKSLKPLLYFRPAIIWGPMGSLSLLRNFGFLTFGDFIDESYDLISDHEERLIKIIAEIERLLCELSKGPSRNQFIDGCFDACVHNQAHIRYGLRQKIESDLVRGMNFLILQSGVGSRLEIGQSMKASDQ